VMHIGEPSSVGEYETRGLDPISTVILRVGIVDSSGRMTHATELAAGGTSSAARAIPPVKTAAVSGPG